MKANLLTHQSDLSFVLTLLREKFGPEAVTVEGEDSNWTSVTVVKRKFLGRSTVKFNALHQGQQLNDIKQGLAHVFSTIPTEKEEVRQKLLIRIAHFNSAIALDPGSKLTGFEDTLFALTKELKGLIFWDGSQMLNEKGHLVMDFSGDSRVDDIEVYAEEDTAKLEAEASEDALARKESSSEWLKEMAVPINQNLPPIQGEEDTESRSLETIASRALALTLVALKGEGLEQEVVERVYSDLGLDGQLSPNEYEFYKNVEPDAQDRVNFVWRYESLFVLLWAMGYADELGYPGSICDVQAIVKLIHASKGVEGLMADAKLRSQSEILDEADRIYRLHWAVVDARLRGDKAPADLEGGVVYERHYALNWLIGYQDALWDDISTNT